MTAWNELRTAIILSHIRPGHEETDGCLTRGVSLIIPVLDLFKNIVADIVIAMERLCLASRANPHGSR